ncbi:tyrosine-type recombinase/integrase [Leucobacter tenebrionis]|uniref:tyrosine-type recombinase/integrase n=1 Tax=Leucobacter tenebrionis TaxID=2873270 RepID=UPI001CA754E6|nr:tyrosine-type recombinase/integrase [Leucobacter tenebrionis]QZY52886.1 site-specific integrase [Leucobacter tenebrionis]
MATIKPYTTASGKRYRVRYRKPDGSQTDKRGFKTKREAELFLASTTISKATGDYIDPQAGRTTISALGETWLAGQTHLKPSSAAAFAGSWRTHVEPQWGDRQVASITYSEIQAWVADLTAGIPGVKEGEWKRKPKSATTVHRAHSVLSAILDTAARDRLIASNPARGVKLPRKGRRRHAYLSHAQVAHLAREAKEHALLVNLLAYTGLRWGEATALRVEDIDQMRKRLRVSRNAVTVAGKIIPGSPKTHRARTVPVPAFLLADLLEHIEGRGPDALVVGDGVTYQAAPAAGRNWFSGAVKRCRAVDGTFPAITPHDLRHTAASLAIQTGANVKAVQRMLGHASAAMTLDVYADLFEDDLDAVGAAMDDARRAHILPTPDRPQRPATPLHAPQLPQDYAEVEATTGA